MMMFFFAAIPRVGEGQSSLEKVQSRQQEGSRSVFEFLRAERKIVQAQGRVGYWERKD
jgi:hypothetical protein